MLFHGMYHEAAPYALARLRVLALLVALALLELAPKWAVVVVLLAALRRKKLVALDLLVWPAIAGLCLTTALPWLFRAAAMRDVLGDVRP